MTGGCAACPGSRGNSAEKARSYDGHGPGARQLTPTHDVSTDGDRRLFAVSVKRGARSGLYPLVTRLYDEAADGFDPDKLIHEAVDDGDIVAAATIALESYGWEVYGFIVRQVQVDEVDEVFVRVADELLRGLPELVARDRVRGWIYTLVHGAWVRTQAGDPRVPLASVPAFARWVYQLAAGYRSAKGLVREVKGRRVPVVGSTSSDGQSLVAAGGGRGLPRQLNAIAAASIRPARRGMERIAMSRVR